MTNRLNKLVCKLVEKQKIIFLIDSAGAFSTAVLLFAILRPFNHYIGMPKIALSYLSFIAISICSYSAICFLLLKQNPPPFIKGVVIANLLYCAFTIRLIFKYYPLLTKIGIIYFIIEIMIICLLSYVELKVAAEIKENKLADN